MKEDILKKAMDMFLVYGYKSVTMDDIAAEMGISKKTIYQHFANKNDLVEAATMHLFDFISTGIDNLRAEKKNSIEEMYAIRSFLRQHLNDEKLMPFHQLQKFFPKIFACLRSKQFEKVNGCMIDNIQRGIQDGLYRPEINVDFISRIYFTGLTGIKDSEIFPQSANEINDLTRQYLEYHLRAITTPKGLEVLVHIIENNLTKL
jgi:AcrR family transcriptional regulator